MLSVQANRGRALEDLVEEYLSHKPGLMLFRQHNRWVPLRGGRAGAYPARGAPVDFVGSVRCENSGIPVALECKEVSSGNKFYFSRLPKRELEALQLFEENAGGRSFLVVWFREIGAVVLYPLGLVLEKKSVGTKSLLLEDGLAVPEERFLELGRLLKEAVCRPAEAGIS